MTFTAFSYETQILEQRLDSFGHVNHAEYVRLFEEARWDLTTKNGYGLDEVLRTSEAPIVIELQIKFRKELKLRETVRIETRATAVRRSLIHLRQEMRNQEGKISCMADVTIALFDLQKRSLLVPTEKFLKAIGVTGI
jgi:acyl-CoA thioester hydrolase